MSFEEDLVFIQAFVEKYQAVEVDLFSIFDPLTEFSTVIRNILGTLSGRANMSGPLSDVINLLGSV